MERHRETKAGVEHDHVAARGRGSGPVHPARAPYARIAGKRSYDGGRSFVLDCTDLCTDDTFTVEDLGDWWARVQAQVQAVRRCAEACGTAAAVQDASRAPQERIGVTHDGAAGVRVQTQHQWADDRALERPAARTPGGRRLSCARGAGGVASCHMAPHYKDAGEL